jgi:hypothetical protein
MRRREVLYALAGGLQGKIPVSADWIEIIHLANESMTTAGLAHALCRPAIANDLPADVREFLETILERNTTRNKMLASQLIESVQALQSVGVDPVLMKGAALLVQQLPDAAGQRMTSDIDLLVLPQVKNIAIAKLEQCGYTIAEAAVHPDSPVTLARPRDVGMIDLHVRPRGPRRFHMEDAASMRCMKIARKGVHFQVPTPETQILHLVLHDQFHNRDYWKGIIDLRHVSDMKWIADNYANIDWNSLLQRMNSRTARSAIAAQTLQAQTLLNAEIPESVTSNRMARVQLKRCLVQLDHPAYRVPFTIFTILADLSHRNRDGFDYHLPRFERGKRRMRGIWRALSSKAVGKI